jgi:hypothetical protein
MARLRKKERWFGHAQPMLEGASLAKAAERYKRHRKTTLAFYSSSSVGDGFFVSPGFSDLVPTTAFHVKPKPVSAPCEDSPEVRQFAYQPLINQDVPLKSDALSLTSLRQRRATSRGFRERTCVSPILG